MVHVHVDQLNTLQEKETQLLASKTKQYGLEGRVVGIHGISIASHPKKYRKQLYRQLKTANLMMIACPTAWIDTRRSEDLQPFHNALTPAEELTAFGVTVALGTDNIADIYKPFSNGDMWLELRLLLEGLHFYDLEALANIATLNGQKVLGIRD
jgi:cytosine/adenosine deaminase-related metal-dependent hydrolase